jgi:hypothetical protein
MIEFDPYHENGYAGRAEYLQEMADEYDCPIELVRELADILGEDEDFDMLISSLRDYEEMRD